MKGIIPETKRLLTLLAIGCGLCRLLPAKAQESANPFSAAASSSETNAALSSASPAALEDTNETDKWKSEINREALVVFGKDAELKTNESAEAVVVIGGSAKVSGKVRDAVVVIGGDAEIDGEVGDAVVAVLGSVKINPGAVIHNEVVSVGGKVDVANGAHIHGGTQEVDLGGLRLGKIPQGLKDWFVHCVLKFRLLAPQVGWVWFVAIAFFLVYLLITLALPRPVTVCVDELTRRPMTTFFIGLLVKLLVPLVMLLLIVTGIGIVVVPFLQAALIAAALIGKACAAAIPWPPTRTPVRFRRVAKTTRGVPAGLDPDYARLHDPYPQSVGLWDHQHLGHWSRHHRHIRRPPPRISPEATTGSIHYGRVHLACHRRPDGRRSLPRNGPAQPNSPVGRLGSASSRSHPAPDLSRASRPAGRTLIPDS